MNKSQTNTDNVDEDSLEFQYKKLTMKFRAVTEARMRVRKAAQETAEILLSQEGNIISLKSKTK